ncbi:DNA adenine methylase [Flavobacterium sp. NRK F7]|uniref:DNA adenine methylase n=1 Tax=Flavobacterium sp. NRK F7 TaxID=2954930 RepID=UPI0020915FC5|nr:DNA adenine methylase [Flavobacterium sp. NRK F7]MCO6162577.1 DNA adenine methylase [Flavobacterium sp. NRK F7]
MIKEKKLLAFNYFGGKYNFINELYSHFPEHTSFVDLMCGSMVVTLNKKPSKLDTANDVSGDVMNFFKVLRDKPEELFYALKMTPVHREEYKKCYPINDNSNDVEIARRFFVRCRMSFQGSGLKEHTGFNACITSSYGGVSQNVAKFTNAIDKLPEIVERLRKIQFESLDYSKVLEKYDTEETFFYVDPPYELRERNYKKMYTHEFTDENHYDLSQKLNSIKGKAMVSMYESKLYSELYKDWRMVRLKPIGHSMKKEKQLEIIWMNY